MRRLRCSTMFIVHLFVTCAAQSINVYTEQKRDMESYEKKANFYNELLRHFEGSFHTFPLERFLVSKICPLTWMEDSNKQKWASDFRTEPCLDILSPRHFHVFVHYQSDCFLSYNTMHTGFFCFVCFYIETSVTSAMFKHLTHPAPFNKICLITITNFFYFFFFCYQQ